MKKTITIGAASLALAAMPIVGVFATTQTSTVTDVLSATISSACTFLRYGAAGAATTDATPAWTGPTTSATADNDATASPAVPPYHTYSATFKPGMDVELGTSTFTGYCNDAAGFTVTVVTPDLATATTPAKTLPFLTAAPSATTSEGWTLVKDKAGTPTQFTNLTGDTEFMKATGPTDSSNAVTETATYTVYTKTDTKSGTYTGNVVYTFTYDDPS